MAENDFELNDDGYCFGCGKNNPIGLKLEFVETDDDYVAEFTPKPEHQGWHNITHGGILALVADEAMGGLTWVKGHHAVTAEMSIRFKRPARSGIPLRVSAQIERVEGRVIFCKAKITSLDGEIVSEATARMVKV